MQVEIILESFKDQKATNEILLRAITIMLPYVIDVDHFANMIRKLLGEVQYQECLHRFGYFAMWSPLHPEGKYDLDLLDREHRDVLIIVASLLQQDPTIDAVDCQFQPSPMHAWDSFDINTCALKTLPHSNGLALSPPSTLIRAVNNNAATTEAAAAAASSAKPQKGKDGNATASKPIPIQDLKCGRVTFKIKSKSMDSMLHPAEGEIRSAAWSQLTTPGEIIARQQAARYVFLQYKHALTRHALLYGPAATSASWSTSPTMASTMYNVYPNFK